MDDRADWGSLVNGHQAEVWRYLRYLGCDPGQADDLSQETFLALLRSPFRAQSRSATSAYLRATARHLYLKRQGERAPERLADADAVWERYARDDGGDAFREALRRCVDALPEDERQALFRRYRDGLSLEAAAPALGLSAEGLKTRLRRLKERLKECVEQRIRREEA